MDLLSVLGDGKQELKNNRQEICNFCSKISQSCEIIMMHYLIVPCFTSFKIGPFITELQLSDRTNSENLETAQVSAWF